MPKRMMAISLLPVICVAATGARADTKADKAAISVQEIQSQVVEAQRKYDRVIINLKNGKSVSGTVWVKDEQSFSVIKRHDPFGTGDSVEIKFSEVASIQGRNPVVKSLKRVGIMPVVAALTVVVLPTCLISGLFHRPIFCPCSSGSWR
ncbi:MAG: hypothetical protein V7641_3482 [Blastocatellia bacterium]